MYLKLIKNPQTELNVEGLLCDVESLRKEYEELKQKCTSLQQEVKKLKFCMQNRKFDIEKYKDSDNDISFYTGFPNYGGNAVVLSVSRGVGQKYELRI